MVGSVNYGTASESIETAPSGDTIISPPTQETVFNAEVDTSAEVVTQTFGDGTGGVAGIRCNAGAMEAQDSGGTWTGFPAAASGGGGPKYVAAYSTNTAQVIPTGATTLNFDDKIVDADNIVTTGVSTWGFYVPEAGVYRYTLRFSLATLNWDYGDVLNLYVYSEATPFGHHKFFTNYDTTGNTERTFEANGIVNSALNDRLYFITTHTAGGTGALVNDGSRNQIAIWSLF